MQSELGQSWRSTPSQKLPQKRIPTAWIRLRKRMQGKACFNFIEPDEALFRELADLTQRSAAGFRNAGYA